MENKLYRCPYSKTDSVACDMQSPCIECKVYFPDTMDKIFTSHNTASTQSTGYECGCECQCPCHSR
jgi:hypothetical protein